MAGPLLKCSSKKRIMESIAKPRLGSSVQESTPPYTSTAKALQRLEDGAKYARNTFPHIARSAMWLYASGMDLLLTVVGLSTTPPLSPYEENIRQ